MISTICSQLILKSFVNTNTVLTHITAERALHNSW